MDSSKHNCKCPCHSAIGIFVILFGLTFLLKALNVLSDQIVNIIWPTIIILAGGKKMLAGMCKCCSNN